MSAGNIWKIKNSSDVVNTFVIVASYHTATFKIIHATLIFERTFQVSSQHMPLSTRYIVMINDALDAIPLTDVTDFMRVAAELEKIISDATEPLVFDPRFKESLLSIQEYFDPAYSYVEPHEQAEFSKLLKEQIQKRIDKFRGFTEEKRQEILTEREEENVRKSNNQSRIAAFEHNRAAHEALMKREEAEFIQMQQSLYESYTMRSGRQRAFFGDQLFSLWRQNLPRINRIFPINDLFLEILFNRLVNSPVNVRLNLFFVRGLLLQDVVGFISAENPYGTATTFLFALAARFRAHHDERLLLHFQQPQRLPRAHQPFVRLAQVQNAVVGVSLLAMMIQGFFTLVSDGSPVVSIGADVTIGNIAQSLQRLQRNPFIFPAQLLLAAIVVMSYALFILCDVRREFPVARDVISRAPSRIHGMWHQVQGDHNSPPERQETVVIEIPDDDLPGMRHQADSLT